MGRRSTCKHRRLFALVALAGAAAAGTLISGCIRGEAATPVTSAATIALSRDGDDASCRRGVGAPPCRTPARAWSLARGGDTITVADGDFSEGCSLQGTKTADVTFKGSPRARFVCPLSLTGVSHASFDGVTLYALGVYHSSYVTVRNLLITCVDGPPYTLLPPGNKCDAHADLEDSDHLTFRDVSIGPAYDSSACGGAQGNFFVGLTNAIFYRVTFKDARYQSACANGGTDVQHTENVYFTRSRNVTFDSCVVSNGPNSGKVVGTDPADGTGPSTTGIFLTGWHDGPIDGLTIENCIFTGPRTGLEGASDASLTNTLIVNNTLVGMAFQYPLYTSLTIANNISSQSACPIGAGLGSSGGVLTHNLWYYNASDGSPNQCGSTNYGVSGAGIVNRIFNNYSGGNFSLRPSSPAINAGDQSIYAPRDFNGHCRPQGRTPDIGAYEYVVPQRKAKPAPRPKHETRGEDPAKTSGKSRGAGGSTRGRSRPPAPPNCAKPSR